MNICMYEEARVLADPPIERPSPTHQYNNNKIYYHPPLLSSQNHRLYRCFLLNNPDRCLITNKIILYSS